MARVSRNARSAVGSWSPPAPGWPARTRCRWPSGWPSPAAAVGQREVDGDVDQGRHDHPAQGGDDRDQSFGRLAQRADGQLPLELQAGHEEEDRQQPVGSPVLEVERSQRQVQHRLVAVRTEVGPEDRDHRRDEHERTADGLLPQHVGDGDGVGVVGGRAKRTTRGRSVAMLTPRVDEQDADQASRHTAADPTARTSTLARSRGSRSTCRCERQPATRAIRWWPPRATRRRLPRLVQVVLDQVHHRGVGQGGDVAELAVLGDVAEQPAHDLAGAGLGQLLDDHDLPRPGDRADLLGHVGLRARRPRRDRRRRPRSAG